MSMNSKSRAMQRPLTKRERSLLWEELCALEPELLRLHEDVPTLSGARFCRTHTWYFKLKPRLVKLIGHNRHEQYVDRRPCDCGEKEGHDVTCGKFGRAVRCAGGPEDPAILHSSIAYEIAYDVLYDKLPPCGHLSNKEFLFSYCPGLGVKER